MSGYLSDMAVTGNVLVGGQLVEGATVLIDNGKIAGITVGLSHIGAKTVIDATGKLVLPGAIDSHVHSLSFPGEGFYYSTRSAAAGGVTTIIDMPVDAPAGIADVQALAHKIRLVEEESYVDVALLGSVKNETIGHIPDLKDGGVCGFKLSLFDTDADRFPRVDDGHLLEAFSAIAETGLTAGVHAENDEIIKHLISEYSGQGKTYPRAHCETRPVVSETESVLKALEFALATQVRLHLYHLSCARSVDLAQMYRRQGVSVTTETCPHYLIFSEENMDSLGARIRINPPVRTKADKSMLWQKIRSGEIDCVSSDHAPWPIERKSKESIFDNASGCPGVETLLPLMYSEGVTGGHISLSALARVVSETPARTFGLFPGKGALLPGSDADLVILDPEKRWTVRSEEMNSSAGWTPYEGMEVKGKVETTVVRGEIVFSQGKLLGKKGSGRFVKPVNAQKAQRDGEH